MSKAFSSDKLRELFPRASQSFLALNSPDLAPLPHSEIAEQDERKALDDIQKGTPESSPSHPRRFKVIFRVRSCQPCDWDNYRCKELQDLLVKIGALPDDKWCILEGQVIPEKVCSREEEGTLIEVLEETPPG